MLPYAVRQYGGPVIASVAMITFALCERVERLTGASSTNVCLASTAAALVALALHETRPTRRGETLTFDADEVAKITERKARARAASMRKKRT